MKQKKVCVIGLGYVGLPMAVALSNVKVKGKFYYQTFGQLGQYFIKSRSFFIADALISHTAQRNF